MREISFLTNCENEFLPYHNIMENKYFVEIKGEWKPVNNSNIYRLYINDADWIKKNMEFLDMICNKAITITRFTEKEIVSWAKDVNAVEITVSLNSSDEEKCRGKPLSSIYIVRKINGKRYYGNDCYWYPSITKPTHPVLFTATTLIKGTISSSPSMNAYILDKGNVVEKVKTLLDESKDSFYLLYDNSSLEVRVECTCELTPGYLQRSEKIALKAFHYNLLRDGKLIGTKLSSGEILTELKKLIEA